MLRVALAIPSVAGLLLAACSGDDAPEETDVAWVDPFTAEEAERVLAMSPLPPPPPDPTNAWADDPDAAHLGRWLYFDPRFSGTGEVSCATCHLPAEGWADDRRVSTGIGDTARHANTVWNTAYNRWMFWDGRADSHWAQALAPMEDGKEHGFDRLAAAHLIASDPELTEAFRAVFAELPDFSDPTRFPANGRPSADPADPLGAAWSGMALEDQEAVNLLWSYVGKAIAAFERTIVTRHAPIDDLVTAYREGDTAALAAADPEVIEGLQIFTGRGNCHFCHLGPNFTNGEFHNIGLGPRDWLETSDRGRFDGILPVLADPFNGAGAWSDDPVAGAEKLDHVAHTPETLGQFKVPTLRNVATRGSFMHGGHFESLEDVVRFYSALDEEPAWGHREDLMVPLDLTEAEIASVVAFLNALTGDDTAHIPTEPPASPIP